MTPPAVWVTVAVLIVRPPAGMTNQGSCPIVDVGGVRVRSVSRYPAGDFGRDVPRRPPRNQPPLTDPTVPGGEPHGHLPLPENPMPSHARSRSPRPNNAPAYYLGRGGERDILLVEAALYGSGATGGSMPGRSLRRA